mmetsp:Transcript_98296/g.275195  ORF Transcript_98296/g.275195 Transcript_98296/m.275195 type:complete len:274 (-) Transcript_98296:40-861(-)
MPREGEQQGLHPHRPLAHLPDARLLPRGRAVPRRLLADLGGLHILPAGHWLRAGHEFPCRHVVAELAAIRCLRRPLQHVERSIGARPLPPRAERCAVPRAHLPGALRVAVAGGGAHHRRGRLDARDVLDRVVHHDLREVPPDRRRLRRLGPLPPRRRGRALLHRAGAAADHGAGAPRGGVRELGARLAGLGEGSPAPGDRSRRAPLAYPGGLPALLVAAHRGHPIHRQRGVRLPRRGRRRTDFVGRQLLWVPQNLELVAEVGQRMRRGRRACA